MLIVINICTFRRPQMLKRCLASIARLDLPEDWSLEVVVVDNDSESSEAAWVGDFARDYRFPLAYRNELRRGIPYARNAACEASLERNADWLLFIDDDEEAEVGWLCAYARAIAKADSKVYTGPVRYYTATDPVGKLRVNGRDLPPEGAELERAATNNVMIAAAVFRQPCNMRFDEAMALTGGEDSEFFMRYRLSGGKILSVSGAVVREAVQDGRQTVAWKLRRQYQSSANMAYINRKLYGQRAAFGQACGVLWRAFPNALLALPVLAMGVLLRKPSLVTRALKHWARAAGTLAGYFGWHLQPYSQTDGH